MPPKLTTELVRKRIKEMENGEYRLASEYIDAKSSIQVLHEPCGALITVRAKGFLQEGAGRCRTCNPITAKRGAVMTEEVFHDRFAEQLGTDYTVLGAFTGYKKKVLVRHEVCGTEWEVTPHMLIGAKQRRCPTCSNEQRGSHLRYEDYLGQVLASQSHGEEYEWLDTHPGDNKVKLLIRHKTCNREYRVRPNDFQQGYRCPHCRQERVESYNCELINRALTKLGLDFQRETTYEGLVRTTRPLRFDFDIALPNGERLIIEYDGVQHFQASGYITGKQLAAIQARDRFKNQFCAERSHLHLHRIDYQQDVLKELLRILAQYGLFQGSISTFAVDKPLELLETP